VDPAVLPPDLPLKILAILAKNPPFFLPPPRRPTLLSLEASDTAPREGVLLMLILF
jgi:hypothetical protein